MISKYCVYFEKILIDANQSNLRPALLLPKCFLLFPKRKLPNRPKIEVENLNDEPVVDGNVLDDPIWKEIAPITTLTQVTPKYGAAVSEPTHIRLRVYKQNGLCSCGLF